MPFLRWPEQLQFRWRCTRLIRVRLRQDGRRGTGDSECRHSLWEVCYQGEEKWPHKEVRGSEAKRTSFCLFCVCFFKIIIIKRNNNTSLYADRNHRTEGAKVMLMSQILWDHEHFLLDWANLEKKFLLLATQRMFTNRVSSVFIHLSLSCFMPTEV